MKSDNKKFYFILSGLLLASIVGLFVTLYFARGFLYKISDEISITKAEVDASRTQLDNLKTAGVKLKKYPELSNWINTALPKVTDYNESKQVRDIIRDSGISTNTVTVTDSSPASQSSGSNSTQPNQTQTNTGPCKKPLSTFQLVSGVCVKSIKVKFDEPVTYDSLITLLKNIESSPVMMQVSSITIGSSDTSNRILVSSMDVNFFSRATQ